MIAADSNVDAAHHTELTVFDERFARPGDVDAPFSPPLAASQPSPPQVAVQRNGDGAIRTVRIGAWRTIAAGPQRSIADVRRLEGGRVAVRLVRRADGENATSEIWQLYNSDGRLASAMQTSADGQLALLTNYLTRQACRLQRCASGRLEAVETWEI